MNRWSPWAIVEPTDSGIISDLSEQTVLHGEKRLMLAVLESATEDFQKYVLATNTYGKQLFQDAEDWFLAVNDESFFSFENVCHYLQLDPDYIRKGLSRWKETQRAIDSPAKPVIAVGHRRVSDPPVGYRRSRAAVRASVR